MAKVESFAYGRGEGQAKVETFAYEDG